MRSMPAARARASTASSWSAKSGKSRWQWLSIKPISLLSDHVSHMAGVRQSVGLRGSRIQRRFDGAARNLQPRLVDLGRNVDRLAESATESPERKVDRGAVPVVEHDPTAGRNGDRIDCA